MAFFSGIPALFYAGPVNEGEMVILDPDETRHARALRLRVGDRIQLLDGQGRRAEAKIEKAEKGQIAVTVYDTVLEEPEQGVYIGLAVGMIADKGRMEWILEKGVEFGLQAIYPLRSERAEGFFNIDRARRVGLAALKQSQRAWLPELTQPVDWKKMEEIAATYDLVLLCHEQGNGRESFADVVRHIPDRCRVLILVGPEGGFSDAEVIKARECCNARIVSLGDSRLRSETVAISAPATLRIMKQGAGR